MKTLSAQRRPVHTIQMSLLNFCYTSGESKAVRMSVVQLLQCDHTYSDSVVSCNFEKGQV